jgi:hypothetical protein
MHVPSCAEQPGAAAAALRVANCKNHRHAQRTPLCAGNAAVKDCLEENREQDGFTPECKQEIEAMMERRAKDVRLDSTLMEVWASTSRTCT